MPNMGMIMPNMGTTPPTRRTQRATGLSDALFTSTQQRVLGLLFGQPDRSFYANEVIALTGAGSGATQRELARLEQSGLVTVRRLGTQKHFQANRASPLFKELCSIARKTFGLAEPLRDALAPLAPRIEAAFVYGSVAKRQDTASSDIDVMVITDKLTYADLYPLLEPLADRLGRAVNPTVLSRQSLRKRIREDNAFTKRVLAQPRIWLIGSEDVVTA